MIDYFILTKDEKEKHAAKFENGCCYEIWDSENRTMRNCGIEVYGKRGKNNLQPLCKEHFEFAKGLIG